MNETENLRAQVAAVREAIERRGKLHARWNGETEMVVRVSDLTAALDLPAREPEHRGCTFCLGMNETHYQSCPTR